MERHRAKKYLHSWVNVMLRVPALFVLEVWFRLDPEMMHSKYEANIKAADQLKYTVPSSVTSFLVNWIMPAFAALLILLPLKKLVDLYMHIISAVLLLLASSIARVYVHLQSTLSVENQDHAFAEYTELEVAAFFIVIQILIPVIIAYLLRLTYKQQFVLFIFTLPILAKLANLPLDILQTSLTFGNIFISLSIIVYFTMHIGDIYKLFKTMYIYCNALVQLFGWISLVLRIWREASMQTQFFIFWSTSFSLQWYMKLATYSLPIFSEAWFIVLLSSIGDCCATPVSLLGLCVTVSYSSYALLMLTKFYLQGWRGLDDEGINSGWAEGFTMFLLAIQTGLTELKSNERTFLMSIVLFILVSSLLQSMYELTDPVLLALSASHNKSVFKHTRVLLLCTFLWMFPLIMTYWLCLVFEPDLWLFVIVSSCLLTSVQVIGSIVVYSLFMYDSFLSEPWERLDDVVYFARAATRVLEFLVAVFVVGYGVSESLFGQWSWINSSILIVHFYFNVWQRAQEGWHSFLLRKEAVKKLESLPLATPEELEEYNDICPICYQELETARITPCRHFFHGLCLKKWLYVQDRCPLCHQKIEMPGATPNNVGSDNANEPENNQAHDNLHADFPADIPQEEASDRLFNDTQNNTGNVNNTVTGNQESHNTASDSQTASSNTSNNLTNFPKPYTSLNTRTETSGFQTSSSSQESSRFPGTGYVLGRASSTTDAEN